MLPAPPPTRSVSAELPNYIYLEDESISSETLPSDGSSGQSWGGIGAGPGGSAGPKSLRQMVEESPTGELPPHQPHTFVPETVASGSGSMQGRAPALEHMPTLSAAKLAAMFSPVESQSSSLQGNASIQEQVPRLPSPEPTTRFAPAPSCGTGWLLEAPPTLQMPPPAKPQPATATTATSGSGSENARPIIFNESLGQPWAELNESGYYTPPEIKAYDLSGDLILIAKVGQQRRHLQVSSKLLGFKSQVWNDLITQNAKFKDGIRMMSTDDDFEALTMFLQIIHFQFSELPLSITFKQLHKLAQFSEKYGVYEVFLPFVEKWIEVFLRAGELNSKQPEWVLIAWEFCPMEIFSDWTKFLCWETEKDKNDTLVYQGKDVRDYLPKARRLKYMEYIQETRLDLISELIDTAVSDLGTDRCSVEASPYRAHCNAMKDGFLTTGLNNILGWREFPPKDVASISISANTIKNGLLNMKFETMPLTGKGTSQEDHSECGLTSLKEEVTLYVEPQCQRDTELPLKMRAKRLVVEEGGLWPGYKRLGFWKEDFLRVNAGDRSDDRGGGYRYASPEYEPVEEYQSEGFEEDDCDSGRSDSEYYGDEMDEEYGDEMDEEDGEEDEMDEDDESEDESGVVKMGYVAWKDQDWDGEEYLYRTC